MSVSSNTSSNKSLQKPQSKLSHFKLNVISAEKSKYAKIKKRLQLERSHGADVSNTSITKHTFSNKDLVDYFKMRKWG